MRRNSPSSTRHYKEFGSLSADVKYINLRNPQDKVPQPIDKYR